MPDSLNNAAQSDITTLSPAALLDAEAILLDGIEGESELRAVLDGLPAAVYTTDADGRITYFNRAAAELAGREPELGKDEWCVTWRLYNADGTPLPHNACPMAVALRENRPIRGVEAVLERPGRQAHSFHAVPDATAQSLGLADWRREHADRY